MPRSSALCSAALAIAVLVALPSASSAQRGGSAGPRVVSVGLGGAATVPLGDYADIVKSGANIIAFLQYDPKEGIWGVRGEVQYHRGSYSDDALATGGASPGETGHNGVGIAALTGVLRASSSRGKSMTPYLLLGLGLYTNSATVDRTDGSSSSSSENGFGYNGGVGVKIGRGAGLFIETRLHQYSFTSEGVKSTYQFVPVSIGIVF
jgi:hypothetical protein